MFRKIRGKLISIVLLLILTISLFPSSKPLATDGSVSLSVDTAHIAENGGTAIVTATLSSVAVDIVTVTLGYSGTASGGGTDYTAGTVIIIPVGNTTGSQTITAVDDSIDEEDETIIVDIDAVTNATENGLQQVTVTITDDDMPPDLSVGNQLVLEGDSGTRALTFTVTLSQASVKTVTLDYATTDGTATSSIDYYYTSGTLTFSPGETSKTVSVLIMADNVDEHDETFYINLSNPTNAAISDAQGVGTILNDDSPPEVIVDDQSVTEGDSGTAALIFTVTLSQASDKTVTLDYVTADRTATSSTDYYNTSGTLSFSPGETSKTVSVLIMADNVNEYDETFYINLSNPTNATISDAQGVGTILDDDSPPLVSVNDPSVTEGDSGTAALTFTITLSHVNSKIVTVDYATADGTAQAGTDYVSDSGTLSFSPGETSKTVSVLIMADNVNEYDETFNINLSNPTNAMISDAQGVGTILDDDSPPSVSVNDPSVTEGDSGTVALTFTITLSQVNSKTVTVDYATADGTAQAGTDYVSDSGILTFNPGETSKIVGVTINADTEAEKDETLYINLANPTNAVISDAQGVGTIADDDSSTTSGGGTSNDDHDAQVIVNGEPYAAGTSETGTNDDGQTRTIVTIAPEKLGEILKEQEKGATVTIPITTGSDVAAGVLSGKLFADMQKYGATLAIETERATYTIPTEEIINAISARLGEDISLSDITVTVEIAVPSDETVAVVEDAAEKGGFSLIVPAIDFTITCEYNGTSVELDTYSAYVERLIAIPEGTDPNEITTAVVVKPDGTTYHVPTEIIVIEGVSYARIKSLTNSTYAVVWHPVEFDDMVDHWAKDTVNDMGSRMIVEGDGTGNFNPDNNMTRAQLATIIVRALGLTPMTGESGFDDIETTDWCCGYVKTAAYYDIVEGNGSGKFGPDDLITREQAMIMIARAMNLANVEVILTYSEVIALIGVYSDSTLISDYAVESVAACLEAGVIHGKTVDCIAPADYISRAEVAVMVQRFLQYAGLI